MQVLSKQVKIPKTNNLTTKYIEESLTKLNINPLRWAIVHVDDTMYTISVADLEE